MDESVQSFNLQDLEDLWEDEPEDVDPQESSISDIPDDDSLLSFSDISQDETPCKFYIFYIWNNLMCITIAISQYPTFHYQF